MVIMVRWSQLHFVVFYFVIKWWIITSLPGSLCSLRVRTLKFQNTTWLVWRRITDVAIQRGSKISFMYTYSKIAFFNNQSLWSLLLHAFNINTSSKFFVVYSLFYGSWLVRLGYNTDFTTASFFECWHSILPHFEPVIRLNQIGESDWFQVKHSISICSEAITDSCITTACLCSSVTAGIRLITTGSFAEGGSCSLSGSIL